MNFKKNLIILREKIIDPLTKKITNLEVIERKRKNFREYTNFGKRFI